MHELELQPENEKGSENGPQTLPFQVQIKYTSLDGQKCLRVFTETRPVTSERSVANQGKSNQGYQGESSLH